MYFIQGDRSRFPSILAATQAVIALALALIGKAESTKRISADAWPVWDYIAPAEKVLHAINFPAALATGLTTGLHTFQIGLEYSTGTFIIYLGYIFVIWYCLGNMTIIIFVRGSKSVPRWLASLGIVAGALVAVVAFSLLRGPYGIVIIASGFLWSFTLTFTSLVALLRH